MFLPFLFCLLLLFPINHVGHILFYYLMAFLLSDQGDNDSKFSRRPSALFQLRFLSFLFLAVKNGIHLKHTLQHTSTRTSTCQNLMGRSMTAPSPVLSPSSILPPHSSVWVFITAKKTGAFKNAFMLLF